MIERVFCVLFANQVNAVPDRSLKVSSAFVFVLNSVQFRRLHSTCSGGGLMTPHSHRGGGLPALSLFVSKSGDGRYLNETGLATALYNCTSFAYYL